MHRVVYHAEFQWEAAGIVEYLAARNQEVALRFVDSLERTVERLRSFPGLGTHPHFLEAERHQDVLFCLVDQFADYLLFYRVSGEVIDLLHLMHGARDIPDLFGD